jgi:hypothetical protein
MEAAVAFQTLVSVCQTIRNYVPEECILQTLSSSPPLYPDQLWGPCILLRYINKRLLTGGKAAGGWNWQLTSSNCVGLLFRQRQDSFLFSETFRPILGPTQSYIQWVLGGRVLFPGVKRPECEVDHSHPPSAHDEWS